MKETPVYTLNHKGFHTYLGMAIVIPNGDNWKNVYGIYNDVNDESKLFQQILIFTLIDVIGVAALFLISTIYIKRIIKPLEEGQEKQNSFVAAASHELRSPLTVIKAGIASIKEDKSKADLFLSHIEGECDRMTRLISDMLLLASADTKTWSVVWEPVDMDTLLIEMYDMFCTCYNEKHFQLTLDLPEESLLVINGDKERLKQILTILVDNAMSYSRPGDEIAIRAYSQKHSVVIEVEDHGKGICDKDKEHIFERFYRGDKSRNNKKHFGLGLSIAKELAELHKGDITIRDTLGGGATFILKLPY
jgi:signal transduction histidine kinase